MAKTQTSAGGIIFRKLGSSLEVALIGRKKAEKITWQIPKGMVEEGEEIEKTAQREVREETGLSGEVFKKIGKISYWYYFEGERIFKSVHFFLLKYIEGSVENHDDEVDFARWFQIEEAEKALAYKNEREILAKAKKMIEDEAAFNI